jgi:hypothetical protein
MRLLISLVLSPHQWVRYAILVHFHTRNQEAGKVRQSRWDKILQAFAATDHDRAKASPSHSTMSDEIIRVGKKKKR